MMFVSLVTQLDLKTGQATMSTPGTTCRCITGARKIVRLLARTGMVMGIEPETPYTRKPGAEAGDFSAIHRWLTDAMMRKAAIWRAAPGRNCSGEPSRFRR
jgi:hypothetical protein